MRIFYLLFVVVFLFGCAMPVQETAPVAGVQVDDGIQQIPTVKDSVVVPVLPEVVEAEIEPDMELTFFEKIERVFPEGCVIQIEEYDVSGQPIMGYHSRFYEEKKYPDDSRVIIVARWSDNVNKRCGLGAYYYDREWKELISLVREEELISLDFISFDIRRDSYGYDQLVLLSGSNQQHTIIKVVVDRINLDRFDELYLSNFVTPNVAMVQKLRDDYYGGYEIHKFMVDFVFKRWKAMKEN